MNKITTLEQLENHYDKASERAIWKEIDYISPHYQAFIEASPFLILATYGEKGVDCSPRGDPAGFVRVPSERQILIPDRRGNNRLDSLRNIISNNKVGLIFLVPGAGETIRVSGTAEILTDSELCLSFAINNKAASSVLSISVDKAYFQCQKAIARSGLWNSDNSINRSELPSAGDMVKYFADLRKEEFNNEVYDENYPEHMKKTIY
jgi:PPOX class probable FMN-dependent enzyme